MLKALLKKQFLETLSFFVGGGSKTGKRRSLLMLVGLGALMLYAVAAIVYLMWETSSMLCAPLVHNGLAWTYFALMGTMAFAFGLVGSVFATKTKLYEAKDNELLLSMPIPSWVILLSRMIGLYLMTLFFVAVVFIPAAVCYFTVVGFSWTAAIFCLLITLITPFGVLALSCLLGWLIALVTARFTAKNLLTCLFLVAFLVLYSVVYSKINELLTYIIANGEAMAEGFQTALYPFWQMGLAATGEPLGMLLFSTIFLGVFALVYWLLSATFLRIITQKRTGKKAKYTQTDRKSRSAFSALVVKESKRYLKNPMILFNCGLGSVLALVLCALALFNLDLCAQIAHAPIGKGEVAVILTVVVGFIAASNIVSGSSVSLEGENIWILHSMPLPTTEIFKAKLAFHILYTALPVAFCNVFLCALLEIPFLTAVFSVCTNLALTLLCAAVGLAVNLKLPNLKWTSEVVAVKQSVSALVCMFAGWGIAALVVGGHFLFGQYLYAEGYFSVVLAVFVSATALLWQWLKSRGVKIFENL